ncbi:heptaprenyl diphosphate synthase [Leucobacter luti]|uniref:polyprenyl synthetase family protein n=1 Tax=Leucobacter luti TaxID=340320 RepID=UPI001050B597|nr:polyprenyl synthetase family protein [Leucobacter luti]MCW2287434.1 geranylgeranyl pyrophosphate synthase [Leucobacter luti]TCK41657.1 heptaprenyl diphosphate synthase [Leucobacter luti]
MSHPHINGLLPRSPEELDTLLRDVHLRLESVLASEFGMHEWAIRSPAQLTALSGGKHVRARAFLAAALAYGAADDAALVEIAAAIELLHTSSLVHDDIIDGSSQRRGEPTLHLATSAGTAILVGDSLLGLVFQSASRYSAEAASRLSAAYLTLNEGQLLEESLGWAPDQLQDIERYCTLKTGALFGVAFALAGHVAGLPDHETDRLDAAGRLLGLAFQPQDDILDVQGDAADLGKDAAADVRNGVPTFPLWYAYQSLVASDKRAPAPTLLLSAVDSPEINAVVAERVEELRAEASGIFPSPVSLDLLQISVDTVVSPLHRPTNGAATR